MPVWEEPAISKAGDKIAIEGHSNGTGVFGDSANWRGVVGKCNGNDGFGVMGESGGSGVVGVSKNWHGVYGETSGQGATGAAAVFGDNKSDGPGILGKSANGPAGVFDGRVKITQQLWVEGTVVGHAPHAGTWAGEFYGEVKAKAFRPQGSDYAENFDAAEGAEPGTVLVIGENGLLAPCSDEYDTSATGVVSGAGGLNPGNILEGETEGPHNVTVALAGQVYVKADAAYGAISVGDLLTTSPNDGFAMRVADRPRAVGAIIGKALSPLASGTGLVRMLVANS